MSSFVFLLYINLKKLRNIRQVKKAYLCKFHIYFPAACIQYGLFCCPDRVRLLPHCLCHCHRYHRLFSGSSYRPSPARRRVPIPPVTRCLLRGSVLSAQSAAVGLFPDVIPDRLFVHIPCCLTVISTRPKMPVAAALFVFRM